MIHSIAITFAAVIRYSLDEEAKKLSFAQDGSSSFLSCTTERAEEGREYGAKRFYALIDSYFGAPAIMMSFVNM